MILKNYLNLFSLGLQGTILIVFNIYVTRYLVRAKLPMDNYTSSIFVVLFMLLFLNILSAPIYISNIIFDEESKETPFGQWYKKNLATIKMFELASACMDTILIRVAIWLNTMHWFSIIVKMDEQKNRTREMQFKVLGIVCIGTTILSEIVKWLYIENGTVENRGFFVILLGRIAEGYIITLLPILCYIYIYHRLSKNFTMIISTYH